MTPPPDPVALPDRIVLPDGRTLRVRRLHDAWRVGNRWWRGEPPTVHLLVDAAPDGARPGDPDDALTLEIHRDDVPDAPWRPERTWD